MKIYFAGGLFDHKELAGNALLAEAIVEASGGKYECILPQNFESRGKHPKDIRNADIDALLSCDAALFNYDGTELDSGTVVEYMFAKFADKPAVLLRTDFSGRRRLHGLRRMPAVELDELVLPANPHTDSERGGNLRKKRARL